MKLGLIFGLLCAVGLHVAVILFGGLLFPGAKKDQGTLQQVELLTDDSPPVDKEKQQQQNTEKKEEMESETEKAPSAVEIIRDLEVSAVADAPALDAASLSAIEAALNGQGGRGGDFAEALSFSSGGRIGGMGKTGEQDRTLENAFSLSEIDQKPRAVFQAAPIYPADMRGKRLEGVVTVIFVVDAAGKVSDPRVEASSDPAFDRPALDAVRRWKFEPAVKAGQRVACKMRVPIRFQPS